MSRIFWFGCAGVALGGVAGCGSNQVASGGSGGGYTPPVGSFVGLPFSGRVMAGQAGLAGAAVQLYAAGRAGNGSAPTQLLAAALFSNTDGSFNVAGGSYTCPDAEAVLYVVASGGSLGGGTANTAMALMTVPGTCGSLLASPGFVLNEVTTAATAYALRPFLSPGGQLGATATNAAGLELGVDALGSLVDLATGVAPGPAFPSNGTAPVAKLNTVGNLLHGCTGAVPASAGGCTSLFAATTAVGDASPTNTLEAAISLANHPNLRAFSAVAAGAVFRPALTAAPPDWTLGIPFTGGGMHGPTTVSVDASANVWVVNYFGVASVFSNLGKPLLPKGITGYGLQESYGGAVDATGRMWVANEENADSAVNNGVGSLTVLDSTGPALPGNSLLAAGGLNFPIAVAFDRGGTAWVVDYGNSHLSLLSSAGAPLSGASGYSSPQLAFPVAVATDAAGNGWVANQSGSTVTRVTPDGATFTSYTVGNGPSAVAVDAANNVWTANFYGDSLGLVSAAGQVLSGGGFPGGGLNHPTGVAVDGAGTAWAANYRAAGISALAGVGAMVPGAALSPGAGWGSELALTEAFGVAIDPAGDVWVSSYGDDRLVELVGAAAPVRTPLLGGVRVP